MLYGTLTVVLTALLMTVAVVTALAVSAFFDPLPATPGTFRTGKSVRWDPTIGYRHVADLTSRRADATKGLSYSIYTDSRGARINGPGVQTPEKVDLLTLGGSFTHGDWVESEATFTQLLAGELGMTAANFGLGGYGTVPALLILERNLDLAPEVIVYTYIRDHARRNLAPCRATRPPFCLPQAYVAFDDGGAPFVHPPHEAYRQEDIVDRYTRDIREKNGSFGRADILWKIRFTLLGWRYYLKTNVDYPRDAASYRAGMEYLIGRMARAADRIGAKLVVVYVPHLNPGLRSPPPDDLSRAIERHESADLIFVDLSGPMNRHYEDERAPLLKFENDGHPSEAGHAFIAAQVAKALRPHL